MSIKALSADLENILNPFRKIRTDWLKILQDAKSVRIMRLSIGATIAMALAYAIDWPLAMLTPMFTVVILSLPFSRPSLYLGLRNMLQTLIAFVISLLFTLYLLPIPFVFSPLFGLALFYTYYYVNRGGSFWFTLMLLISLLLMPMLANLNGGLAAGVSIGFVWSGWVAVWLVFLAHYLVPDPQTQVYPQKPAMTKAYVPVAATLAFKSSLVAFPIAILFITFQLTDYILVMIFAAIFTLSPDLSKGKQAIKNSLISTFIGGIIAYIFYWSIVAIPEYHFFILLFFLVSLVIAALIFSDRADAKYYSSALVAMIVLFDASIGEDKDFTSLFVMRVILMSMAGIYVILALKFLNRYWPSADK